MKMACTYKLVIEARCPADPEVVDRYRVEVESEKMMTVESILEWVGQVTAEPIYQEHLTQRLADLLDAQVTTIGTHSGVWTKCSCS